MDELYREDYWDKLPTLINIFDFSRHLKDNKPFKLLKTFGINEDFDKINLNYFMTKRFEIIKELAQREEKVQKAYSNADRIMAMDKKRREGKN